MANEIGDYVYSSKIIGRGSFSLVYKGFNVITNQVVAIKKINIGKINENYKKEAYKAIENIDYEIDLLKTLNHPNIIKYYDYIKTPEYWYIILEYCEKGDLSKLFKCGPGNISEETTKKYMKQLASVLKYLRDNNIVHRDIKPHNILLSSSTDPIGNIKLIDFNFARELDDNSLANTYCGSPLYMAPEIMKNNKKEGYNSKSDLWSIGVLLYEMVYSYNPFIGVKNINQILEAINADSITFKPIPHFKKSRECIALLKGLLEKDINKRISWEDFFNHEFIMGDKKFENLVSSKRSEKSDIGMENDDEFVIIIYKALWWAKSILINSDLNSSSPIGGGINRFEPGSNLNLNSECLKFYIDSVNVHLIDNLISLIHSNHLRTINDFVQNPDNEFIIRLLTDYYNSLNEMNKDDLEDMSISELKFYVNYTIQKLEINRKNQDDLSFSQSSISLKDQIGNSDDTSVSVIKPSNYNQTKPIPISGGGIKSISPEDFIIVPSDAEFKLGEMKSKSYPQERFLMPKKVAKGFLKQMSKSYNTIKEIIGYMSNSPNSF